MIRINLLPFRAARKKENVRRQVSIFLLSVLLVAVVVIYYNFTLTNRVARLTEDVEQTRLQITKYQKITKEIDQIKKKLAVLKRKNAVIQELEADRRNAIELLDNMTRLIVAKRMWLTDLASKKDNVSFKGIALDNKTVADFMTRLEKSRMFASVNLQKLQKENFKENLGLKNFEIRCGKKKPPPKVIPADEEQPETKKKAKKNKKKKKKK